MILTPRQAVWLHDLVSLDEVSNENLAYNTEGVEKDLKLKFSGLQTNDWQFELHQNRPNPFVDETTISFNLPETHMATLSIYDVTGRQIYTINKAFNKGYNEVKIDKSLLQNSGMYLYRLQSDKFSAVKRMQVFKD